MKRPHALAVTLVTLVTLVGLLGAPSLASAGPLSYRTQANPIIAGDQEGASAACPVGTRVTGGGATMSGPQTSSLSGLMESMPGEVGVPGGFRDGWFANAVNRGDTAQKVRATAICLRPGEAQLVDVTGPGTIAIDQTAGDVEAVCAPGLMLIGGGASLEGPAIGYAGLMSSAPRDDLPVPAGWAMSARRPLNGSDRDIFAAAMCLPAGLRTVRYPERFAPMEPGEVRTLQVRCRRAFHVSAGGVTGQFLIRTSMPFDGRDKGKAPDDGWRARVRNRTSAPQLLEVNAICLK
jgi:hypothetical protein